MSGAPSETAAIATITTSPAIAPRLRRNRRQIAGHGPASSDHPSIAMSPDGRIGPVPTLPPGGGAIAGAVIARSGSRAGRSRRAPEPRIGHRVEDIGEEAAAGDQHATEHGARDDDGVVARGDRIDGERADPRP